MTDLDTRIAALLEAVRLDGRLHWQQFREAFAIIDEQAREIGRLREQLRLANVDACIAEAEANVYRDAGPTPFQGRTTRRNEYEDEGRN